MKGAAAMGGAGGGLSDSWSSARALVSDIWLVARQELDDAIRARRAAVVLLIYLAGAMLACNGMITALHRVETELSEALQLAPAASAGAVTDALWKSHRFRGMVISLVGDKAAARDLLSVPPIALIYGWLALFFTAPLIMLTAPTRIAEEVASGSARLVLLRTSRPAWCIGKFLGQTLLVVVALLLSAAGAWCIARFRLAGMDGLAAAQAMLVFAAKAWVYGLAIVGLALGVSQATRSPGLATALGLVAWVGLSILNGVAGHYAGPGWGEVWQVVVLLTPQAHRLDLCRNDLPHVVSATLFLGGLGFVYLFAGYAWFARKDV